MENNIEKTKRSIEAIKRIDEHGNFYWASRELYSVLGYSSYTKFSELIKRSIEKANTLGYKTGDLFYRKGEMVEIGSGAVRERENFHLSLTACQFITEYADWKKPEVKVAKSYFFADGKDCDPDNQMMLPMFEDRERIKAKNMHYWEKMSAVASERYKNKMKMLGDEKVRDENKYIMRDLRRDDSFLHRVALHHIMYKQGKLLISKDGFRAYEFLIEYDIFNPSVGIYYGCKGLTLNGNHDGQIEVFIKEWEEIKIELGRILSNTFPNKNFSLRFKQTDNANNDTYWPFWITLYEDEDIVNVAARAILIIRRFYQKHFGLVESNQEETLTECVEEQKEPKQYDIDNCYLAKTDTSFTEEAYNEVIINKLSPSLRLRFISFLQKSVEKKYLDKEACYDKAWIIISHDVNDEEEKKLESTTDKQFLYVIKAFFTTNEKKPKWEDLSKVILNKKGKRFDKMRNTLSCSDSIDLKYNAMCILDQLTDYECKTYDQFKYVLKDFFEVDFENKVRDLAKRENPDYSNKIAQDLFKRIGGFFREDRSLSWAKLSTVHRYLFTSKKNHVSRMSDFFT